jgi:hypothetical protein
MVMVMVKQVSHIALISDNETQQIANITHVLTVDAFVTPCAYLLMFPEPIIMLLKLPLTLSFIDFSPT